MPNGSDHQGREGEKGREYEASSPSEIPEFSISMGNCIYLRHSRTAGAHWSIHGSCYSFTLEKLKWQHQRRRKPARCVLNPAIPHGPARQPGNCADSRPPQRHGRFNGDRRTLIGSRGVNALHHITKLQLFGSGKFDPDPHWDNTLEMKETISGWADEFEQATKGRDWNAENGDYILAIEAFIAMKLAELVYRFEAGR